jgi:hypothetical protein
MELQYHFDSIHLALPPPTPPDIEFPSIPQTKNSLLQMSLNIKNVKASAFDHIH